MDIIASQNRREAHDCILPKEFDEETKVMVVLRGYQEQYGGGMTPEEIGDKLNKPAYQVRPRTTTLNQKGRLAIIGKRKNAGGRNSSVYRAIP